MAEDYRTLSHAYRYRESLIGAVSAGFFLVLLGVLFIATPGLFSRSLGFVDNFELVNVPHTAISFFAPAQPQTHGVVYTAVEQFCFAFGVFHVVILALRFAARSTTSKKADTIGNLVFWIGTGYLTRTLLINTMLLQAGTRALTTWFVFWAALVILAGITLIIRAIILAATIPRRIV